MKDLFKIGLLLSAFAALLVMAGCGEDEATPEDFKSLEQARFALDDTQYELFSSLDELTTVTNVALTFDGNYPGDLVLSKNRRSRSLTKTYAPHSIGYNAQTGYWTFDTTYTEGFTVSANGKIRFTPRDPLTGLPNESTNTMEYGVVFSVGETAEDGTIELLYDTDVNVTGIAAYRASTGNATVNGSDHISFTIDATFDGEHIIADYRHAYKINNVIISPTVMYPQSGSFGFTIKRDFNVEGFGENFYIEGRITFDGTNIALLEFGGFTFHINLDGPYIVEFD
jgi:hypothetical protein